MGSDTTWSQVAGGGLHQMGAVKTDGTLWTWGYNEGGNLGHNNRTNYSSPKQVPGTNWSRVKMSDNSTLMFTEI